MADFYIGQGDTASSLVVTLRDANENPVNITGASVHIDVAPIHGGAKIVDAAASIADAINGVVSYTFTAPQTAVPGDYLATFTVTFGGGQIESFPNAGYYLVTINPDAATTAQEYVSVEELKKELQMTGTTYADQSVKRAIQAASKAVDNYCDRVFTLGTSETRVFYPFDPMFCYIDDAATITSVVANSVTLVAGTDYRTSSVRVARPGPPYDTLRSLAVPGIYGPFGFGFLSGTGVSVTGTFGWPSVPAPIQEATILLASRYLQRTRQAPMGIVALGDGGEASRILPVDPDVASMLQPYRRYVREG